MKCFSLTRRYCVQIKLFCVLKMTFLRNGVRLQAHEVMIVVLQANSVASFEEVALKFVTAGEQVVLTHVLLQPLYILLTFMS